MSDFYGNINLAKANILILRKKEASDFWVCFKYCR